MTVLGSVGVGEDWECLEGVGDLKAFCVDGFGVGEFPWESSTQSFGTTDGP